ncbi:MAG: hypothetical protein CM1200mP30_08480 [Pseudomonadota bacterium]|nr:MAG: hypothetical protein CM1200mP30_08480 [Pseudomonadota bacterium]
MIKTKDVLIPDIGEFDQVEVIEVLVKSGDTVSAEDPLLTMESDKASMDVPSPFGGIVKAVKIKAGDKVSQNDLILTLSVEGDETSSLEKTAKETSNSETSLDATSTQKNSIETTSSSETTEFNADSGIRGKPEKFGKDNDHAFTALRPSPTQMLADRKKFLRAHASPSIRKFARELGVDPSQVQGKGRKGRITQLDVQVFVKQVLAGVSPGGTTKGGAGIPEMPEIDFSKFGSVDIQPLSRIKKKTGLTCIGHGLTYLSSRTMMMQI